MRFLILPALLSVSKSGATCTAEGSKSANWASSTSERRDSSSESSAAAAGGVVWKSGSRSLSLSSLSDGRSSPRASGGGMFCMSSSSMLGRVSDM